MGSDGKDFGHDHAVKSRSGLLNGIHLQTGHGQTIGQFLSLKVYIHIISEPLKTNLHLRTLNMMNGKRISNRKYIIFNYI